MLLLSSLAAAHVPHDNVEGIAVPESGDGAWALLLNPTGEQAWMMSADNGYTWTFVGGAQLADVIGPPQVLGDGSFVALGEDRYWYSPDGLSWSTDVLPAAVDQLLPGGELALAGADGLWEGTPGGPFTRAFAEAVTLVGFGAALREDGEIMVPGPGGWTSIGAADGDVTALVGGDDVVYAGTADGRILRWDVDGWSTCGDTGDRGANENDVVQLAWDGKTLLAATGTRAPWVSTDACATWVDRSTGVLTEYGPGTGGAETEADAFTALRILDQDRWVVAGWAGLYLTSNGGTTWVDPALVPPEDTRGFAFAGNFPEDPRVFIGAYSTSVLSTADGGLTWSSPNHGVASTNVTRLYTSAATPDRVWGILNHNAWISDDGGGSWRQQDDSIGLAEEIILFDDPLHWWVLAGQIYQTADGGETFEEALEIETQMNPSGPTGIVELPEQLVVAGSVPPILVSRDSAGDWATWYTADEGEMSVPVSWPTESPSRIVVADDAGVHVFGIDGELLAEVEMDEDVRKLARLGDDRLLAITRSGLLLLSEDGGSSWSPTDLRLPWSVSSMRVRPDWDAHPEVLVGSYDGVWIIDFSGAPTMRLWSGYERLDDIGNFLVCTGCPDGETDTAYNLDSIQPLGTGKASAWIRGVRLGISGESGGGGAEVQIDGETVGTIGAEATVGELGTVEGLDDAWHRLDIVGMPDNDVSIDFVDVWRDTEPLDLSIPDKPDDTGDTGDSGDTSGDTGKSEGGDRCGCGSVPGAGSIGLLALLALRVSSRRARSASTRR